MLTSIRAFLVSVVFAAVCTDLEGLPSNCDSKPFEPSSVFSYALISSLTSHRASTHHIRTSSGKVCPNVFCGFNGRCVSEQYSLFVLLSLHRCSAGRRCPTDRFQNKDQRFVSIAHTGITSGPGLFTASKDRRNDHSNHVSMVSRWT